MQTTTTNAVRFFRLLILILGLTAALMHSGMNAQIAEPSAPVDTTPPLRPAFRKWLGIGGHIASSTYISNSETIANGVFGKGFWLSLGPLESLELDWLRLDVIYTSVVNNNGTDSVYLAINKTPPTNHHQTLDIKARFIANPRAVISFFGTFGLTNFVNDFGALKWRDDNAQIYGATPYHENLWGIGGSLGLSGNINTPFGTIAPTAEWEIAFMYGERLKNFRGLEFIVSQQRVGILLYPDFQKLFGK